MAMIARDKLYQDKILAPIREYACNALDAHAVVGKAHVPIRVTLPTTYDAVFKIRDFGKGLSEEGFQNLYVWYGRSDKRFDNKTVGVSGIGCKSGFAYGTRTFMVTSFYNGRKTIYNLFLDENGDGNYTKMSDTETNEENGIEISIHVLPRDINEFYNKARDLFSYFKVRPQLISGDPETFYGDERKLIVQDKNFAIYDDQLESVVVMGNVPYPLKLEALSLDDASIVNTLGEGVVIYVPIGTVDVAASREALEYTNKTKNDLIKKLEEIKLVGPKVTSRKI